jgi:single-strand DNA-binding protein
MPGVNYCFMMGNLTADPELRFTGNGKAVTTFDLAINRFSKNQESGTTFVKIVAWEILAENCAKFLKKGSLASVEGRLQIRPYTTKTGENRKATEIIANNVQFLNSKNDSGQSSNNSYGSSGSYSSNSSQQSQSNKSVRSEDYEGKDDYMTSDDLPYDDISMDDIPF